MRVGRRALLAQIDKQATEIANLTDEVRTLHTDYLLLLSVLHQVTTYTSPGSVYALRQQALRDQLSAAIVEMSR